MDKLQITNKKPSELFDIENPKNPLDDYDANGDLINQIEISSANLFDTGGITGVDTVKGVVITPSPVDNKFDLEKSEEKSIEDEKKDDDNKGDDEKIDKTSVVNSLVDNGMDYHSILTSLMDRKVIPFVGPEEDIEIDEGVVVKFKDLKIDTSDEFLDYLQSLFEEQRTLMLENKMDVSTISDITKTIIDIDKNGGNIEDIKRVLNIFSNQITLDGLDPDNISDAEIIIREYYTRKGEDDSTIKEQIILFKSAGEEYLKSKAEKFKEIMIKVDNIELEKSRKAAIEREKSYQKFIHEYRKNLKNCLRTNFQLNDNYLSKIADFGTSKDKDGWTGAHKAFNEITADPAKAAELYLYLFNKDEYIKQKSSSLLKAKTEQTRKLIRSSNSNRRSSDSIQVPEKLVIDNNNDLSNIQIEARKLF